MHKLIEGLTGIEAVADDFIAAGLSNQFEETTKDHKKTPLNSLKQCEESNVCLNAE